MKFKEIIQQITEEDKSRVGKKNNAWKSKKTSKAWTYTGNKKASTASENEIGYRGYHMRIVKEKGKASEHKCRKCGEQAKDWAIVGKGGSIPLCRSCHNKMHHREENFKK